MEQYKKYRVTPELAQEWLDRTGDNNYHGSQMLIKKRWKLNGESIKLSPGLKVLEGPQSLNCQK